MADLNSLVVFAKVVEANISRRRCAALKMPISTVSRRIAELEDDSSACVRLLERTTLNPSHRTRAEILDTPTERRTHEAVDNIVSNPCGRISFDRRRRRHFDTLLTPLVTAFQASYPNVRVQILVTNRFVDHIAEGMGSRDQARRALKDFVTIARGS